MLYSSKVFRRVRKIAKSDYLLASSCLSVRLSACLSAVSLHGKTVRIFIKFNM